ncbi:hypothetical protein PSYMO_37621, partial [Pseudomonas amygdali pv. mori str. 301020]
MERIYTARDKVTLKLILIVVTFILQSQRDASMLNS